MLPAAGRTAGRLARIRLPKRASYNGITSASQADDEGSTPFARSSLLHRHIPPAPHAAAITTPPTMSHEHHFEGDLRWTGQATERDGKLHLVRRFDIEFPGKSTLTGSSPEVFHGDNRHHNPETLMVSSLMACHHLTYLAICERSGVSLVSYADHGTGKLAMRDGKMRMVEVVLRPQVRIADPAQLERATALHEKAHANCFMSNSVNFEVHIEPTVTA